MHSIESLILPIWSPKNKKFEYGGYPAIRNNSIKSLNWPLILPHIVIGGDMLTTYSTLEMYYNSSGSGFAEVPYSDLNVNNSLTTVLGKDLDIARIFYYSVCNN